MQGDLISKKVVLDFIKEEMKQDRPYDFKIRNIERFIQDLPTAYDVEKVIEQLEDRTDFAKNFFTTSKVIHINTARKYIRNGGKE